jgi:hypothetical protein
MRMLTAAEMIQSLNSGHTPKAVITGKLFAIRGCGRPARFHRNPGTITPAPRSGCP